MQFDFQPTLRGNLVTIEPLEAHDFEALYAVASDPLLWEQHPNPERCQRPVFEKFFEDAMATGSAFRIRDAKTGAIIGSSRYYGLDFGSSEVEVGWTFLQRSYWGGRYNGEMKALMLEHAFQFVDNVILVIGPQNYRSQGAARKIGAVYASEKPQTDRMVFRITAEKFRETRR